jgi:hypothetical protein
MQKVYVMFGISMNNDGDLNFWCRGICDSIETADLFISKNKYMRNRIFIGRRIDIDVGYDEKWGDHIPPEFDWVIEEMSIIDTPQLVMNELTK